MKKVLILIFIVALACIAIFSFSGKRETSDKPIIKIGIMLPLSGDLANIGETGKNAVMMAIADANKNPDNKYYYKLILDDDLFDIKKSSMLANKQAASDHVNAMIGFASTPGLVVAPIAEKHKIIYMNVGASDTNVAAGDYTFVHWTMPAQTAGKLIEFFARKKYKNIVIVSTVDAGFSVLAENTRTAAKKYGVATKTFEINPGEKDFRPVLAKIKQLKPDAIVLGVWGGQLPIFIKQYHETGQTALITGVETFAISTDFSILEGAYFTDVAQSGDEFNTRLKKEYPTTPGEFATGNFYDAVMLIVKAFETADKPEDAATALREIKTYGGAVGKLTQDDRGIFQSTATLKLIKNGKPEITKE